MSKSLGNFFTVREISEKYDLDVYKRQVSKMAFGNELGLKIEHSVDKRDLFAPAFGDLIAEVPAEQVGDLSISYILIGEVTDQGTFEYKDTVIPIQEAEKAWTQTLEGVFATKSVSYTHLDVYKRQAPMRICPPVEAASISWASPRWMRCMACSIWRNRISPSGVSCTCFVLRRNKIVSSFRSRVLTDWLTADWEINRSFEASEKLKVDAT